LSPRGGCLAIYILAATFSAWLSVVTRPPILGDDAAIGLRYAERIATGHGFTYNDHERVCGASNPLWTMMIALGPHVGLDVESTNRVLASVFYAVAAVLASAVAIRLGGAFMGLLIAVVAPADIFWRVQSLAGLELPLAISLGLAAILAASAERDRRAGLFVGLALVTKLDAAALILAIVIAVAVTRRRVPIGMLGSAVLVSLPWFLFAWVYYGRPWPQSLSAKLIHGSAQAVDYFWVLTYAGSDARSLLWVLAVIGIVMTATSTAARRTIMLSVCGWFLLHSLAYSVVNLGDRYPWYVGIPVVLSWVAASAAAAGGSRAWRALVVVIMALVAIPHWRETVRTTMSSTIESWHAQDADRRLAGIFLDQFATPTEIVESGFGWIAYESHRPFVDGSGLNSRMRLPATYLVLSSNEASAAEAEAREYVELARFGMADRMFPGTAGFTVYGLPESTIAKSGRNERDVDATRLKNARLETAWRRVRQDVR
jgi:hypothetical protein